MYQISISGAAAGKTVIAGKSLAHAAGVAVANSGCALFTGATTGLPQIAAEAYKKAGGKMSVGISPATSKVEHVFKYRLPTRPYDVIIYSGMNYAGRDAFLINSSDAAISIGGRLGTLHEALIAMETRTPIAFLKGAGGTSELIRPILTAAGREMSRDIIEGEDAEVLVDALIKILDEDHLEYKDIYTIE
jgi:uncharacterized protein (TIGR00725 family)